MLVLARRIGEEIVIDGDIRLTVVSVRGKTVRLGIAAPPSVPVDREEIHVQRASQFAVAGESASHHMITASRE
jgi:carbon storage regulator